METAVNLVALLTIVLVAVTVALSGRISGTDVAIALAAVVLLVITRLSREVR